VPARVWRRARSDQVAVRGTGGGPHENANATIFGFRDGVDLLFDDGIDAVIGLQHPAQSGAGRVGNRPAVRREALIAEQTEMMPATDLQGSAAVVIGRDVLPAELHLSKHQRRIVDAEVQAVAVALLRIADAGACGIAVENRRENRDVVAELSAQARADRRERRRGTAGRQVDRGDGRPTQRGIGEDVGIFAGDELAIRRQLPGADRPLVVEKLLFEICLIEPDRRQRLDPADDEEIAQVAARQAVAVNGEDVGVGGQPLPGRKPIMNRSIPIECATRAMFLNPGFSSRLLMVS
jgi:hypothetical protein